MDLVKGNNRVMILPIAELHLTKTNKIYKFYRKDEKLYVDAQTQNELQSGYIMYVLGSFARCVDCIPTRREFLKPLAVDPGAKYVYRYSIKMTGRDGNLSVFGYSSTDIQAKNVAGVNLKRLQRCQTE